MYGCESWSKKKAEHQRIDAFELWCWRNLWRVPWTARRSNQSILKEISPEYSWEGCWSWNSNTLATWCEKLTHWKRRLCWERLKAGREGEDRGWDGWMASPTWWIWVCASSRSWWWTGKRGMLQSMGVTRSSVQSQLSNWTELRGGGGGNSSKLAVIEANFVQGTILNSLRCTGSFSHNSEVKSSPNTYFIDEENQSKERWGNFLKLRK